MNVTIDTNRYVDLIRGDALAATTLERAELVFVPFVVIGELRAGFAAGARRTENEALLERFLLKSGVDVLYPSDQMTRIYAGLYIHFRCPETPITHVRAVATAGGFLPDGQFQPIPGEHATQSAGKTPPLPTATSNCCPSRLPASQCPHRGCGRLHDYTPCTDETPYAFPALLPWISRRDRIKRELAPQVGTT